MGYMNIEKMLEKHGFIKDAKKLLNGAYTCIACGHIAFEDDPNPVKKFFHYTIFDLDHPLNSEGFNFWLCEECNKEGRDEHYKRSEEIVIGKSS